MDFFQSLDDMLGLSDGQRPAACCNCKRLHASLSKGTTK
jgi:hypothetical protein